MPVLERHILAEGQPLILQQCGPGRRKSFSVYTVGHGVLDPPDYHYEGYDKDKAYDALADVLQADVLEEF